MNDLDESPEDLPAFISRQVTEARHFFLNLDPDRSAELAVACGGVERVEAEYEVRRERFAYYGIELVAEGKGWVQIKDEQVPLLPGSIVAYGPETLHVIQNQPGSDMRKYYLCMVGTQVPDLLKRAGLSSGPIPGQPVVVGGVHELVELFEWMLREGNRHGPNTQETCATLAKLLLLKVQQLRVPHHGPLPRAHATYERIRLHIDEHYLDLATAREIAAACHISPVYLARLFKRFADCGAYDYLLRRKMNHAAGLLMESNLLVKEVAWQMDFSDAFQFSRAFKRVHGISPSELSRVGGQQRP